MNWNIGGISGNFDIYLVVDAIVSADVSTIFVMVLRYISI